jgi:hypothetical protein
LLGFYIQSQIIFLYHIQRTLPDGNFNIQHGVGAVIKITFTSHKAVSFRNACKCGLGDILQQRFSNFFQVGTTFISQNVLRTTLLLSPLKANCLRLSTVVCDMQFMLILFFRFFLLMFSLRGPQGQNPRTTCGPRTTV